MADADEVRNRGARERWNTLRRRLTQPNTGLARLDATLRSAVPGLRVRARTALEHAWTVIQHVPVPLSALYFVAPSTRTRADVASRPGHRPDAHEPAQVRIIANPTSGSAHGAHGMHDLRETVVWLRKHGLPAELCMTDAPGSARHLAEEAVRAGMRMVVAAGGDGTINEVIQALAGHTTALGVLPMGTVNVWAREANIPLTLAEARAVLVYGARRRIDLGRAGSRYFILMAGIGIDAEVARRVEHHFLKRIGLKVMDYIATGGIVGVTQRPVKVWMQDGKRRRSRHAVQILIGNTRLFGGALAFTQQAVADDGWLDVVFVGGHHLRHRAQVLLRAALRRPSLGPHAHYAHVRTMRLDAAVPLPVQVDGEVIGTLPMTFAVAPRALTVVVPRDAPSDLFLHPPLDGALGN